MRLNAIVLALPALAVAQEQVPLVDQLKGWFNKATQAIQANIPSSVPSVPSVSDIPVANPVNAGAAKIADLTVDRLTLENHKEILAPGAATASSGTEDFMLFLTGGNKTCFGLCGHAETEFNKSVALIAASPNPPHLAILSCETDPVLCNAWALGAPTVLYMKLPHPQADQTKPATDVYILPLNRTSVTAAEIAAIHTETKYQEKVPYEGYFHPFDGQLAKLGLGIPFGYAVWGFGLIPSWAMMIGISFFTRTFMSKKLTPPAGRPAGAPAARAAQ